jgi:hypothetical protein
MMLLAFMVLSVLLRVEDVQVVSIRRLFYAVFEKLYLRKLPRSLILGLVEVIGLTKLHGRGIELPNGIKSCTLSLGI